MGWTVPLPVNVQGEVAVTDDGVILASGAPQMGQGYQPTLYAISSDGEMLWQHPVGSEGPWGFPSRPVLGTDGRIYVTINYSLFALDRDGYLQWSLDIPFMSPTRLAVNATNPPPAPAIGADGNIYWQFLAATTPKGELRWRQFVDPYTPCETALPLSETRVLFRTDQKMVALDGGVARWTAERPLDDFTEPGCGMIPFNDRLVATLWCEPGPSAFVCGHLLFFDIETGAIAWQTDPPKAVAMATSLLMRPDGSLAVFSAGAHGNPDDPARMWLVTPDGKSTGPTISLPWHAVYHVALGDDGIFYATTPLGLAAISETGEVLWRYEPDNAQGSYSGAPAIGSNGCVYYETVRLADERVSYGREISCLRSSATGLADSRWPRSIGGNSSAMRSP